MPAKTSVPIHYCATRAAIESIGRRLPEVATAAFLEIGRVARGYAIHHHQFRLETGELIAVASRIKASGVIEIEIDLGHAGVPMRTYTRDDAARAAQRRKR